MSEYHPLDLQLKDLIDRTHARTCAFVELANLLSDARRQDEELALGERLQAIVRPFQQKNGGSLHEAQPKVNGNGADSAGLSYYQSHQPQSGGLREALQRVDQSMMTQEPYPEETTHPGVPEAYRKAYGY